MSVVLTKKLYVVSMRSLALSYFDSLLLNVEDSTVFCGARHLSAVLLEASRLLMLLFCLQEIEYISMCFKKDETCTVPLNLCFGDLKFLVHIEGVGQHKLGISYKMFLG